MEKVKLNVEVRDGRGKGQARSLRRTGKIPAVMYGQGTPTPIAINRKELVRIMGASAGGSLLLSVAVEGKGGGERLAILRDFQTDPVKSELLHADLQEVAMDKPIHVTTGIVIKGDTPKGVKEGGILQQPTREMLVECLPADIPDHIYVDASGLDIGESLHVRDLALPHGVKAMVEPETVLVSIGAPITAEKLDKMLSAEAAQEVKEPELVKGKEKEEAEEGKQAK